MMFRSSQICVVQLDGARVSARSYPHAAGEARALSSDPSDASRVATAASDC